MKFTEIVVLLAIAMAVVLLLLYVGHVSAEKVSRFFFMPLHHCHAAAPRTAAVSQTP